MKTISLQQPYAELVLQGRKTLDLRTFNATFRGRFAIHASQTVQKDICALYGLDPDSLPRGAIVGTVELVGAEPLTAETYAARHDEHLRPAGWLPNLVGWELANPQRLATPIPFRGRQGWFSIPDDLIAAAAPAKAARQPALTYQAARPFALVVEPRGGSTYALSLYQWPIRAEGVPPRPTKVMTLAGAVLQAIADHVLAALRAAGYKNTDLSARRHAPFYLPEEPGVRLGLLFLTVAPLSRWARIDAIGREVRSMPAEEAYYWYSKCTALETAPRAQQALRVLLAAE